jgi:small subunit ribosomal protein S13|nr:ribosomal protein S13 [Meringosphaera mediterranea]WLD06267.1 ribosomal protein S13 [Meringosphaera mediterranea]
MIRIAGVDLPQTKRVEYALTRIYGIGIVSAQNILKQANINPDIRTKDLTDENVIKIREVLENNYQVESDLRRKISLNLKRLSEINCFRGRRHRNQLPVRGQRTRTNARARRGSKKTVAGKKK